MENYLTQAQADDIINSVSDLIDDPKYMPFYYRKLYDLGVDKFRIIEAAARQGRMPSRRFATLLKKRGVGLA